jgi:8-oxo-dGTP pyrophosphatase MutT (NUDIX family)
MAIHVNGPYQILSSETKYQNRWLKVREDKVIRPGGTNGIFGVVEMQAGSTILALTEGNEIFLANEYKYGIEADSLELISGGLNESESPLDGAKRELMEELGIQAQEWLDMGVINPFTTVVSSPNYMFIAKGFKWSDRNPDEGEVLDIIKVPFLEALNMVMCGKITHGASCVLILKTAQVLKIIQST